MFLHLWFCSCSSFFPNIYVLHSKISPRFFNLCVYWCVRQLHMCASAPCFFLHNRNSSIWGFFLGCSKIWMMGNPVDTPKFGRYEPWFPLVIPCNQPITTEAMAVMSSIQGMPSWLFKNITVSRGTPHIRGGTPCVTWRVNWRSGFEPI